jgi:hypothetical protein
MGPSQALHDLQEGDQTSGNLPAGTMHEVPTPVVAALTLFVWMAPSATPEVNAPRLT